jgi:RimJ/RimL family protein N-acetyltransferase
MIKGSHINLRVVQEKDLPQLFHYLSDIESHGDYYPIFLTPEPQFHQEFTTTGFWTDTSGRLMIVDKNDTVLGQIMFFRSVPYFAAFEIAYILFSAQRRGKGIMTEALRLFAHFLFSTKPINRLQLTVTEGNTASQRVAEKCGFQHEGMARQAVFEKGAYRHVHWYALLRDDWKRSEEGDIL